MKIGDLARLKSGSPLLTIAGGAPAGWRLTWFDGARLCEATLPEDALVEDSLSQLPAPSASEGETIGGYITRTWSELAEDLGGDPLFRESYSKVRNLKGRRGPFVQFDTPNGHVNFWPTGPHGAFMKRATKKEGQ